MKDMNQQILKAQGDPNENKYTLRHIVGKLQEKNNQRRENIFKVI